MPTPYRVRLRRAIQRGWSFAKRIEFGTLVLVLVVVGGLWAFVEVVDAIDEAETLALDERLLLALRSADDAADPLGPAWFEELCRDLTALGGVGVLVGLTLFTFGLELLQKRPRAAVFLVVAVGTGLGLSLLLKHGFDRPRPSLVPHGAHVYTQSFPSGHSMLGAVTYLTLGALQARQMRGVRVRVYVIASALFATACIGFSRVYLGVHWPTDVLAGWTAGAGWACLCWLVARHLQLLDKIETPRDEEPGAERLDRA